MAAGIFGVLVQGQSTTGAIPNHISRQTFGHTMVKQKEVQEALAVASIAQDDPFPLPGMHCDHNVPACTASRSVRPHALRVRASAVNLDRNLKSKLAITRQCTSVTDRWTDRRTLTSQHKREMYILHIALKSSNLYR